MATFNHNLLNNLKKTVFYDLMNMIGRVFVVVRHSENVTIGNRGFQPEEKENGLVLVFNRHMNFRWEDSAIHASLVFGTATHKCYIPVDDIIAIYSPEAQAQFITAPQQKKDSNLPDENHAEETIQQAQKSDKVVKVNFRKKKA